MKHAKTRIQFQQPLAEFELGQEEDRIHCGPRVRDGGSDARLRSALIDSGAEDYMLETAILKVFSTEHLWTCVYECMQVMGGASYFTDRPQERWMRDARINTIGEGANEVLKAFIAVVGCREPGMRLDAMRRRMGANLHRLAGYGVAYLWRKTPLAGGPNVPVQNAELQSAARRIARQIKRLGNGIARRVLAGRIGSAVHPIATRP